MPPARKPAQPREERLPPFLRTKWRIRAALAVIALLAYANSFGLGLATDARYIVDTDQRIRTATAENLRLILTRDYWWPTSWDRLYRPVTTASYLFNYAVLGNNESPAGYHAVNFLLHVFNVWLVWELALFLFKRTGPAFFAAGLWAVHPIGTESVTNIAGRADLLSAMAVLGGLLLYVRSTALRGRRLALAAMALFATAAAGVFSKENAAVLLALISAARERCWGATVPVVIAPLAARELRQRLFAKRRRQERVAGFNLRCLPSRSGLSVCAGL